MPFDPFQNTSVGNQTYSPQQQADLNVLNSSLRRQPISVTGNYGTTQQAQQSQGKSNPLLNKGLGLAKDYYGTGGESAGFGNIGTGDWVSLAIMLQMMAAESTRKSGRNEGGVLQGKFGNDPWQGYFAEKLGLDLTPGERFDKDPDLKSALGAMQQWAYPGQNLISMFVEDKLGLGDVGGFVTDPVGKLLR